MHIFKASLDYQRDQNVAGNPVVHNPLHYMPSVYIVIKHTCKNTFYIVNSICRLKQQNI